MIDVLIKIIDKLIDLIKGRIQGRKDMFEKVIDPIFNDLLLIHGDYIKMFEHAKWLLPGYLEGGRGYRASGGGSGEPGRGSKEYEKRLEDAINEIKKRRLEFEPVRSKVRTITKKLGKKTFPKEETKFIKSVLAYFPTADPKVLTSSASNILEYLDEHPNELQLAGVIGDTIHRHKESWSDVCEAYAELKIKIGQLR